MKVPFFDYRQLYLNDKKEILNIFNKVASKGAFILQKEVEIFENKIKKFTGSKFAIGVANGTDAMQLFLNASNFKKNDEIILSSHTMIATASAIKFCGAKPIPADIDLNDGLIDPDSIEKKITKKTKAIIVTHLNGRTCKMNEIINICKKYNLKLFEDAAQGLGSKLNGKMAGTFGEASSISLYPAKILGCFGDGGLILTNNEKLAKKLFLMRDHGRLNNKIKLWGFNSRLDNIQAGILNYFFDKFDLIVKRRREIASIYNEMLKDIDEIRLPPDLESGKQTQNFDTFQNFEIQAKNRDQLKSFLHRKGVGSLVPWGGVSINNLGNLGIRYRLKNSDKMFKRLLMLPMNYFLNNKQVNYVAKNIKNFYT